MNKILDSKITLGAGIFCAIAGAGLILGGAFGHNFWLVGAGSVLEGVAISLAAMKIRQIFQNNKPEPESIPEQKTPSSHIIKIPSKNIIVKCGGNTYIPNPSEFNVIADRRIINAHAQYNKHTDDIL